jgi:23S rRNA (uracil1939-C5)-methyltransferase
MAGPADPWRQRNKIALHVEPGGGRDLRHGLYALRSRELVALEECPVLQEPGLELAEKLVAAASDLAIPAWDPASGRGLLRSVVLRLCAHSGERHALFVVADSEFHQAKQLGARALALGFQGVSLNINTAPPPLLLGRRTKHLAGARRITETIGGVQYLFSPQSFFQTSTWGAGFVVDALRRMLAGRTGRGTVLDLYCGGGLLALALADRARTVVGVDENGAAIDDAVASGRGVFLREGEAVLGDGGQDEG